jgi:hypothetical protein
MRKKQEFERRKQIERDKKKNKVNAHKKIVSRVIAKKYNHGIKDNSYKFLADVGFFTDKFKEQVLEKDVLPWLESKVIQFVKEIEEFDIFPD